ncbi:MBL fold metallo-hydrolase [Candidatus Daviesbacteria bacterium]|nr:MBL fold metallo-hydrolase [Candidatus Daviesbacteria bacterium]
MKIKKYPQSHLLISGQNTKIIIDPGYITFEKGYKVEEFQGMDGYLITHQHADHLGPETIKGIAERGKGKVYGNSDVVAKLKEVGVEAQIVYERQPFQVGEFEIMPVNLPHCKMQDGSDGPPNTGYLINGILFLPGDGDKNPGITADNFALPIAGPSITYDGALQFAQDIRAKLVIPIHYDSRFPADPDEFAKKASEVGIEVRILGHGEETTI